MTKPELDALTAAVANKLADLAAAGPGFAGAPPSSTPAEFEDEDGVCIAGGGDIDLDASKPKPESWRALAKQLYKAASPEPPPETPPLDEALCKFVREHQAHVLVRHDETGDFALLEDALPEQEIKAIGYHVASKDEHRQWLHERLQSVARQTVTDASATPAAKEAQAVEALIEELDLEAPIADEMRGNFAKQLGRKRAAKGARRPARQRSGTRRTR